ncbi:MAG: DUF72 domain-containing protein [Acidobacteria bacterium]|nr:DUF72 domain-containing protein [Acidobacteriota bacterium]
MPSPFPSCPLRCGVAGWDYPDWDRVVYPCPKPRGFHPLEFLSRLFDVVEISSSFHEFLRPEVCRLWVRRVRQNPQFRFTAKLHRLFTHDRVLETGAVDRFQHGLLPLAESGLLSCLLMQFPWSFRFTQENREYFIKLRRSFHTFPLVAEMRHASWMCEEALGTFIDYHVGFVNLDQPQYIRAMPPTAFLTASAGYVRLHGRNNANWMREYSRPAGRGQRNDYLYTEEELSEWKQRIDRLRSFASEVNVILNNDVGGKSVINALEMERMLGLDMRIGPRGEESQLQETLFGPRKAVA